MEDSARLDQISTSWTVLREAHGSTPEVAQEARRVLLERYGRAVRRYLLAAVGDPDTADELTQEFALDLVEGKYRHADPSRGQFRGYVKGALFHLVAAHGRKRARQPDQLPADGPEPAAPAADADREFDRHWREQLLHGAWDRLREAQPVWHAALWHRADRPDASAAELAAALGREMSADAARQALHRARERFAELLLDSVAASLDDPTADRLEEELAALDLLRYCRKALAARRASQPPTGTRA